MFGCLAGIAGILAGWGMVLAWHAQAGGMPNALASGLAYAGLAAAVMALVSRCAAGWHAALKRMSALLACAILAGIDVGLSGLHGEAGQRLFFAALLGVALVVVAARHAPGGLRRRWLGE